MHYLMIIFYAFIKKWVGLVFTLYILLLILHDPVMILTVVYITFANLHTIHYSINILNLGRFDDSISDLTTALRCNAPPAPILTTRSRVFIKLNNFSQAVNDLTEVLQYQPSDCTMRYHRGLLLKIMNKYYEAIEDFSILVSLLQSDHTQPLYERLSIIYNHRAFCYRKMNNFDKSLQDYSEAIRYTPHNIRAYINRAFIFMQSNRYTDAINDFSKVLKIDPNNTYAYHNRGVSSDKIGAFDQALSDFSRVLKYCL